jgi:SAM-dependent methyltransferase
MNTTPAASWPANPPGRSADDWIAFLLGEARIEGVTAPPMPPAAMQDQFVGSNGRAALQEASTFCGKLYDRLSAAQRAEGRLLDFGVGWGRLYRILLNRFKPQQLVGVDIDPKCITTCKEAMPYGIFEESPFEPPLRHGDAAFDAVYAYSVFSHLAEAAFEKWMGEFARLLKPGGIVAFTTLKEAHLGTWNALTTGDNPYYRAYLAQAGFDYAAWEARARDGKFLYVPTGGGDMRDASFYGEAIVTRNYLQARAPSLGFRLDTYQDGPELPQAFVVLERSR